jgi:hypothetical protein
MARKYYRWELYTYIVLYTVSYRQRKSGKAELEWEANHPSFYFIGG